MPVSSTLRARMVEAIGAALTVEDIKVVVEGATGNDPFNVYGTEEDPRARLISKILARLEGEGTERWLLTHVLIRAIGDERLRKLIVAACPETLVSLPQVDDQVDRVLENLQRLLIIPLSPNLKYELRSKREDLAMISQRIATLYAFKSLHECLHALQLKLTFGSLLQSDSDQKTRPDLQTLRDQIENACSIAPGAAALLGTESNVEKAELVWITDLKRLSAQIQAAIDVADIPAVSSLLDSVQRLVRLQLSRLNGRVFEAAQELSLDKLIAALPVELEIELQDAFMQLSHSIRDLKPTVLARALKHKMWQDADNESSLLSDMFNVATVETTQFSEHWFILKSRILWLAMLDPDAEWAKRARRYSDDIDDQLAEEKHENSLKPSFETYRNLIRLCFLGVDAMLKSDCGSLHKIDRPLRSILQEVSRG